MAKLILVRHGQSVWNFENKFTGWADCDLSPHGIEEAINAGIAILKSGIRIDIACTSVLTRAVRTLHIMEENSGLCRIPEYKTWRLNERHYGALQGLNKAETAGKYGEEQVRIWRRSYDIPPPMLSPDDPRAPRFASAYKDMDWRLLPLGESLKECIERVVPYWEDVIAPKLLDGKNLLVVAHGNSIRGLLKYLEHLSDAEIMNLEIPTGIPRVMELDASLEISEVHYLEN